MTREISGHLCQQMASSPGQNRERPGYWVMRTSRSYAWREESGDVTYWKEVTA